MWRLKGVRLNNAGLPWTLVLCTSLSYGPQRRSHGLWALCPPFGLRCDDTAATRSLGRTHYPQRKPNFSFPSVPPSSQFRSSSFSNGPYVMTHRSVIATTCQGVCPNISQRVQYCGQEPYGVITGYIVKMRQQTCDNRGDMSGPVSTPFFPFLGFKPSFSSDSQGISASSPDEVRA
ncbi:hypothetical protein EDB84DRAFT_83406 [Lactarius hengduanensis]|nr:hypothetical protein EDB84DRAFT_83406 [Lactarius hengduanensis]